MRSNPGALVIVIMLTCVICVAQTPTPQPQQNLPHLSLVPLTLLSVGLDDIARPLSSPTGVTFPTPEFFVPRNGTKTLRSEEHTSELQSHVNLVCRLLLEKKKNKLAYTSST